MTFPMDPTTRTLLASHLADDGTVVRVQALLDRLLAHYREKQPVTYIRTIGSELRKTRQITVIAVPAYVATVLSEQWKLWKKAHRWNGRAFHIYRTVAKSPVFPGEYVLITPEKAPVTDQQRQEYLISNHWPAWVESYDYDAMDATIRAWRGDPQEMPYIFDAPVDLSHDRALYAGTMDIQSEHFLCGVDPVNGRWVYYIGIGAHKQQIGAADTEEEARVMARAHLWVSWEQRIQLIRNFRGGDLSWGIPLAAPKLELNIEELKGEPEEVKPKRPYNRAWIDMSKAR